MEASLPHTALTLRDALAAPPPRTALEIGVEEEPLTRRPRGRPPMGAVLNSAGRYELPPEAIEAAANRMLQHREACRRRYAATRQGLFIHKPELFRKGRQQRAIDEFGAPGSLG